MSGGKNARPSDRPQRRRQLRRLLSASAKIISSRTRKTGHCLASEGSFDRWVCRIMECLRRMCVWSDTLRIGPAA
jgi:hypothetical protein